MTKFRSRIKVILHTTGCLQADTSRVKKLLAVIVEVGLDEGLDVLASFNNGTARYINHTGKILVWETTDDAGANKITSDLFANSQHIVDQIGPRINREDQINEGKSENYFSCFSDGLLFW